jgi:acyl phosphate:glycerol-3-phosphate acyltransferase
MLTFLQIILIVMLSYALGAIPTAFLIARYFHRRNIFQLGSGNMGGTNVARIMGLHWGIITALLDAMKGMVAVYIAQQLVAPDAWAMASVIAALAAVAGHNWSLFASALYSVFNREWSVRGGKGAATAYGTMIMLLPPTPVLMVLVVGVTLAVFTRYASLSVLVSFSVALVWSLFLILRDDLERTYIPYIFILSILIAWRFRENIQRLLAGNERKLGERVA